MKEVEGDECWETGMAAFSITRQKIHTLPWRREKLAQRESERQKKVETVQD